MKNFTSPINKTHTSFKQILLLGLCFSLIPFVQVQKPLQSFALQPEKNFLIAVEKLDKLNNFQLVQPDGSVILLKGVNRFEQGDFNFDTYIDLRVMRISGHNTKDELFLYQPDEKKYVKLLLPDQLKSQMLCDGLMNVQIEQTKSQSKTEPMLSISCSAGRAQNISFDYLRYDAQGALTLAHQYAYDNIILPNELLPYTDLPWGITHQMMVYSAPNIAPTLQRTSQALEPIVLKALQTKLTLHETPQSEAKTILTLNKGQVCNLLNLQGSWLELACSNTKGNMQQGWFAWAEALQGALEKNKPFMIVEAPSAKLY